MTPDDRPTVSGPPTPLERAVVWLVLLASAAFVIGALWQAVHS